MVSWRQCILVVMPTLLLTACGAPSSYLGDDVQAAQRPTVTQRAIPAVTSAESPALHPAGMPTVGVTSKTPPDTCPVTRPPNPPFTPPPPYPRSAPGNNFWYGTDSLWTAVPRSGVWSDLPHNPEGYTQKVLWWRTGYSWTAEPEPDLTVSGRRLDAWVSPLNVSRATNAFAEDIQSAMLVGVDFPTLGCWEITGQYAGTERSFVVWVAP